MHLVWALSAVVNLAYKQKIVCLGILYRGTNTCKGIFERFNDNKKVYAIQPINSQQLQLKDPLDSTLGGNKVAVSKD